MIQINAWKLKSLMVEIYLNGYYDIFTQCLAVTMPYNDYFFYLPGRLCHLFTANSLLAVTVITAGVAKPGCVLAATWVTGELEGNLRTMITSCWAWSVNINGLCRRRYYWVGMTRPKDINEKEKTKEDKKREGAGEEEEDHVNTSCK